MHVSAAPETIAPAQRQLNPLTGQRAPPLGTSLPCPGLQSWPSHACSQCTWQELQWTPCLPGGKLGYASSCGSASAAESGAPTRRLRPARPYCPARCCSQCWPPSQGPWHGLCFRMGQHLNHRWAGRQTGMKGMHEGIGAPAALNLAATAGDQNSPCLLPLLLPHTSTQPTHPPAVVWPKPLAPASPVSSCFLPPA
jgi:hypothetical protein